MAMRNSTNASPNLRVMGFFSGAAGQKRRSVVLRALLEIGPMLRYYSCADPKEETSFVKKDSRRAIDPRVNDSSTGS